MRQRSLKGAMLRSLVLPVVLVTLCPGGASAQGTPPWSWSDEPDLYPMVELRAKIRHNVYVLHETARGKNESQAELRRELSKGGVTMVVWRMTIAEKMRPKLAGAAMVISGDTVYVARYNRIASGGTLSAFATVDGTERWSVALHGIGPVAHSKWFNRVQLSVRNGDPVVFGDEGPGRGYIEVRDAATGKLLANRGLDIGDRPRALAEPLYRELANMLRTRRRYTIAPDAFASRHNMSFVSANARLRAFRKAVSQLDGLPLESGRAMRVSLVKDPHGGDLVEASR